MTRVVRWELASRRTSRLPRQVGRGARRPLLLLGPSSSSSLEGEKDFGEMPC